MNTRQTSYYLTENDGLNVIGAFGCAHSIEVPLNHSFTVLLADRNTNLTPQECTGLLIKNYGAFASNNGFEGAWATVLENSPQRGVHAHMIFHVPNMLGDKFGRAMKRWSRKLVTIYVAQGNSMTCKAHRLKANARHFERPLRNRVGGLIGTRPYEEDHIDLKNVLAYFLKGLNPDSLLSELIIEHSQTGKRWMKDGSPNPWRPHYQGAIEGARCRVSNNIGWKARARIDSEVIQLFPDLDGLPEVELEGVEPLPKHFALAALK